MAQKTVTDFAQLKSAVEDSETTEILIDGDITFSGGIKIPIAKKSLTIDGGGHTITDNNSSAYTDAIYVPSGAGSLSVTVKNAVWNGRNYYGVVCVYDDTANANVITTLDNITYTGPQMIYNRYGTTIVKDCTVSIEKNGASASSQEFCEGNRLVLSGKVTLTSATTGTAVIWFPFAGSAFTVEDNADVTITALSTYMFYTDSAAKPVFKFGANSTTKITVKNGMFYASGTGAHIATSCDIGENATLRVEATANNGVPLFKCINSFTVQENGSVFLIMPIKGNSPLLYFSTAAKLTLTSPKNVLFYSNGAKIVSFATGSASAPNSATLSANQINGWTTAKTPYDSAGGFDDMPSIATRKKDGSNVEITQTLSSSAALSVQSNIADGDEGYPVTTANFDLTKLSVLSLGAIPLSVDKVTDISTVVSGATDPNASVEYVDSLQSVSGKADDEGVFSVALTQKPKVGDVATIRANANFLTTSTTVTVQGSVSITSLPDIPFGAIAVPKNSATPKRIDPNWQLVLTDTRPQGGSWQLYLVLQSPLQSGGNVISNAVTFTDDTSTSVLTEERILVKQGTSQTSGTIPVSWQEAQGVLLNLSDTEIYEKGEYFATLAWVAEFD